MKHFKKLIALFLAMVMAMSFAVTAMAAESDSGIPENATSHTIELTVAPGETIIDGEDDGVAPFIWGSNSYNPPANGATYTAQFTIPDRYFAYEVSAIGSNGNAVNGICSVYLLLSNAQTSIAGLNVNINGTVGKMDWIDVDAGTRHLFKIVNGSSSSITVNITYYSWA